MIFVDSSLMSFLFFFFREVGESSRNNKIKLVRILNNVIYGVQSNVHAGKEEEETTFGDFGIRFYS